MCAKQITEDLAKWSWSVKALYNYLHISQTLNLFTVIYCNFYTDESLNQLILIALNALTKG